MYSAQPIKSDRKWLTVLLHELFSSIVYVAKQSSVKSTLPNDKQMDTHQFYLGKTCQMWSA